MLLLFKKKLEKDSVLYLKVKVRSNAVASQVKEIMADKTVKIDIAAPANKGRANRELVKFLTEEFGVKTGNVKIIRGEKEKIKIISAKGYCASQRLVPPEADRQPLAETRLGREIITI